MNFSSLLKKERKQENRTILEKALLPWYDHHQRSLPWRAVPGYAPNPYHVWLSEIMLQQTTVATVKDYFIRFVARWPSIQGLAQAPLDDIFHAWQGLGYYSRARNLHFCAQRIAKDFNGTFPKEEATLLTLPGIGPYTAAAIAAIAYDQPTLPVDGNVVRVLSRVFSIETPLPALKNEIQALARDMVPSHRSGDFAQSLMDLGATICRPRNPDCKVCPLQGMCKGYHQGTASQLPRRVERRAKPQRYGVAFWVEDAAQQILLERRPDKGLLAGLMGLPTTAWKDAPWDLKAQGTFAGAPQGVEAWEPLPITVRHTFTHFHLELTVARGQTFAVSEEGLWSSVENLKSHALPTVMKKVIRQVISFSNPGSPHGNSGVKT